jgi:HlyD family secretion protein
MHVRVGDSVKVGQVLATLDQDELTKQLQLAQSQRAQLLAQDRQFSSVQQQRQGLDNQALQQQRQSLQQSLAAAQQLTPILQEKGLDAIRVDRINLQQQLQALRELLPTFRQRLSNRQQLSAQGAVSNDTVLQAQQDYLNTASQISAAESQLKQLDVKEADAQRQYLDNLNAIRDLETQLKQLDSKQAAVVQQDLESSTNREQQIQEVDRNIALLEQQLENNGLIKSGYSGRVTEISAIPGQVIQPGTRIGLIAAQQPSDQLISIAFFPISDGKRIQPGMKLQITPTTIQRERFGGIIGSVSDVSAFPVTKEGALSVVGSPEVVQGLMSSGAQIQVLAQLQPDAHTASGYQWSSSRGPEMEVTSGTTTTVRVTVEERAPITFVLPILKSWSGMY